MIQIVEGKDILLSAIMQTNRFSQKDHIFKVSPAVNVQMISLVVMMMGYVLEQKLHNLLNHLPHDLLNQLNLPKQFLLLNPLQEVQRTITMVMIIKMGIIMDHMITTMVIRNTIIIMEAHMTILMKMVKTMTMETI